MWWLSALQSASGLITCPFTSTLLGTCFCPGLLTSCHASSTALWHYLFTCLQRANYTVSPMQALHLDQFLEVSQSVFPNTADVQHFQPSSPMWGVLLDPQLLSPSLGGEVTRAAALSPGQDRTHCCSAPGFTFVPTMLRVLLLASRSRLP